MAKNWREVLRVDRIIHTSLWIGVLCLVIVGCIPEGVDIPGYNPDSSDTTEVVPALEVSVPDGSANYFAEGIAFERTAHEISVVFRVAEDWMVKVVDDEDNPISWCRLNSSLGSAGLHEMKVSVEENTTASSRSARIVLMAFEDVSKVATMTVKQEGVALFLERTCYEVAPKDTTIEVGLKANVGVEYKIVDADWVREQSADSRALTTSNLAFEVDTNPSHKSREAKIIFYSSQYAVSDTLTIAQQGLTPTLTVPEGHTNYFAEGLVFSFMKGEAEVTFHSNVEWTLQIADSTAWCSVSQTSGKAGLQKVKVRVTDNDTYEHRSAVLRLMCDTTEMGEIQVVQNRENAILLGRQDYTVSCEATTIDVSVSTNVDFEYKIIDADWVRERQSATRGLTTHNLTFEVDANPSHRPRETRIAFYSSEYAVADTLTITQRGILLPSATTGEASNITLVSATLSGTVNNTEEPLTCGFIYGTSSTLSFTSGTRVSTKSQNDFSIDIDGLKAYITYYYRAYVVYNAGEYNMGEVKSFTTKESITVITGDATNVTTSGATLRGTVNNAETSLTCGIIYGTMSSLSSTSGTMKSTTSSGDFSVNIAGLDENTTYYYCAYVIDAGTYKYGEVESFKTKQEVTVTTGEAIDLGLSVKWAFCNVGANSPEEYGDYFAWGETTKKSSYNNGNSVTYGISTSVLKSRGIIGSDDNLTAAYDAATVNWGDEWRMPTLEEVKELINNCTWEWTSVNGVSGQLVIGPNGNSIFLPAAGYRNSGSFIGLRSFGHYWSATPIASPNGIASCFYFFDGHYEWLGTNGSGGLRYYGYPVRPVKE